MLFSGCKKSCELSRFSKTTVMKITPPKYPLTHIEPMSGIVFYEAWHFSEPVCYQPSIEWQSREDDASRSQISRAIIIFSPPTETAYPFRLRSTFITAIMYWSMRSDWGYQMFELDQTFWFVRNWIECLSNGTNSYIIKPFSPSFVQNTSLLCTPLKWLISTDLQ